MLGNEVVARVEVLQLGSQGAHQQLQFIFVGLLSFILITLWIKDKDCCRQAGEGERREKREGRMGRRQGWVVVGGGGGGGWGGGGGGGASKERLVQWKEIAHSTSETFTSTSTVKQNPVTTGPRSGNNSKHPAFSLVQWKETARSAWETVISTSRTAAFSSTVQQSPWWKDKKSTWRK